MNEEHRSALEPQIQSLEQETTRLQLELNDDAPKLAEAQEEVPLPLSLPPLPPSFPRS